MSAAIRFRENVVSVPASQGNSGGDDAHGVCDVMVIDDNPHVNKALAVLLRRAGFIPIPCHRGADALDYVRRFDTPPCAAVVDIHLPDISGLVLAQQLRTRFGPETPIVVVSGDTSMETINSLSHVGATCFFSKPVNAAALVDELKRLTDTKDEGVKG
jgi:two-component system CitB family response regulator